MGNKKIALLAVDKIKKVDEKLMTLGSSGVHSQGSQVPNE